MEHCCLCNKWEHAECAGLFDGNKDPDTKYVCSKCKDKQESTAAKFREDRGSAGLKPSTRSRKGSTASTRKNERGTVKSITSTCLSTDVREQLKLIEEERSFKEREIQEQREMLRRKNEESARQLEEKRKLAEEENLRREIEMKAEAELIAREQNARRESLEKKRELMRQLSLPSRLGTEDSYSEKVVCWLSTNKGMSGQRPNSHEDALSRSSSADSVARKTSSD
ncbi:DDRGK domain-containing protein 1-like [Anopheles ziemanni]|uniref:DDRGK domain-containing protein 1-like n=1 Tax=Anopheles coustani TaxID=139045 RepID=UPI00265ADC54|nr:DDRGK domain-containing protein 1-like [Anopheles coustani]XP_058169408.1 DDRGK domain-containing protein 1-like [Anopheles ziemanni]